MRLIEPQREALWKVTPAEERHPQFRHERNGHLRKPKPNEENVTTHLPIVSVAAHTPTLCHYNFMICHQLIHISEARLQVQVSCTPRPPTAIWQHGNTAHGNTVRSAMNVGRAWQMCTDEQFGKTGIPTRRPHFDRLVHAETHEQAALKLLLCETSASLQETVKKLERGKSLLFQTKKCR